MEINVLLVEDNIQKEARVLEFLDTIKAITSISVEHSFSSGCRAIDERPDYFNIVLLDISLPTYDKTATSPGGKFRSFGGREIAKKIIRRKLKSKIIFITQYESFSDNGLTYSFDKLSADMEAECAENFLGMIRFDSTTEVWKVRITELLKGVL